MTKRRQIKMMGSTYAPSVRLAAELVQALRGEQPSPPAPAAVGRAPEPTLQPQQKAG